MSDTTVKNLSAPFGKLSITQSGAYGKISSNGKVEATVPFSAQTIAINGRLDADADVTVASGRINGSANIKGNLTITTISINGRTDIDGRLVIEEYGKLNGKTIVNAGILGVPKSKLSINGDVETPEILQIEDLSFNGRINVKKIEQVDNLYLNGNIFTESMDINNNLIIKLIDKSEIGKIKANNVTIGRNISNLDSKIELFGKEFHLNINQDNGFAIINEIYATGTVELDHVKVDKVYAKELYIDEATEVGEFIELVTDSSSNKDQKDES